jgi:cobalt-zinc-cadmium efflux system outer membrane protein
MFLRCLPLFLSVVSFLAVPAFGANAPELSLDDVLARVATRHPELLARRHHEDASAARVEQAGVRPDPELEFTLENALGTGAFRGVRGVEATLVASQTLERGGKRERRTDLATRLRDVELAASNVLLAELSANAVSAYVGVVLAKERSALAGENLALAREMLVAVERLHADGSTPAAEIARARVAVATAEVDVRRAESGALRARAALAAAWRGRVEDVASVAGGLHSPQPTPTETELQPGLASHPRLAWHEARIAREEASVALAHTASTADLTAAAGIRYAREGSDAGFVAGLSLPLPNRTRTRSEIRAAQAGLAAAEQDLRAAETALQADLARVCQDLTAARLTIDLLRDQALPAAEEARAEVRRAHAEGFLPLIDVLETQRTLLALRRDLLDAQSAFATALAAAESLADRTYHRTRALLSLP